MNKQIYCLTVKSWKVRLTLVQLDEFSFLILHGLNETPPASLHAALYICIFYFFGVNEFQINHERSLTFMEFQTLNKMINILQLLEILRIFFKVSQGQKWLLQHRVFNTQTWVGTKIPWQRLGFLFFTKNYSLH